MCVGDDDVDGAQSGHTAPAVGSLGTSLFVSQLVSGQSACERERLEVAVTQLETHAPQFSAKSGVWPRQWNALAIAVSVAGGLICLTPATATVIMQLTIGLVFAALLMVRLLAIHHLAREHFRAKQVAARTNKTRPCDSLKHSTDRQEPEKGKVAFATPHSRCLLSIPELPRYSVIVALYHETEVAAQLIAALRAMDYPAHKLDILFALEADDGATRDALIAAGLASNMQIVIVPEGRPRTKPRALCYALTFAQGDYIVVYDAEDRPDPGQLQQALAAFAADPGLGCVQARLVIANSRENWLTAGIMAQTPRT